MRARAHAHPVENALPLLAQRPSDTPAAADGSDASQPSIPWPSIPKSSWRRRWLGWWFHGFAIAVLVAARPGAAQTMRSFGPLDSTATVDGKRPIFIELYADGNVRKALQDAGGGQVAAGSLGINVRTPHWASDLLVNTAGTQDALRRGFGTSVLAPGAGGSLSSGLLEARLMIGKATSRRRPGVRAYASANSSTWQPDTAKPAMSVAVAGLGLGAFYGIGGTIPVSTTENDSGATQTRRRISAVLDAGFAWRSIGGDVAGPSGDAVRRLVGMDRGHMGGAEVGATVTYSGLKAGVTYYRFPGDMPGLSHGQIVAGFAVQTSLAGGLLNP